MADANLPVNHYQTGFSNYSGSWIMYISETLPDLLFVNCNNGYTLIYNIQTKAQANIIDTNDQWLYAMYVLPGTTYLALG